MGTVDAVEFVRTKGRSFAYIDFSPSSTNSLTKLFSTYNGCVWKGGRLRLEKAKEHYLARLKREWEAASSTSDNTIKAPSDSPPATHLNIFFPRLRKVKPMPLSGTGKHKYSFQRVPVSSSLPRSFCDCEEHSNSSLTPREIHLHDLEAVNVGRQEAEVNVMNSVMNKLFEKNNVDPEEDNEIEADQDNLIINVASSGNDMDSALDMLSRKRKSILNKKTPSEEGYSEGRKGNLTHPSKNRQTISLEETGRQESSQAIRGKKKPSEVVPDKSSDEPSRTKDLEQSIDNISWSQKSSWKSLMANGNSNDFSVSSFLPGVGSSKAVQPAPRNTDLAGLPSRENLKKKTKRKRSDDGDNVEDDTAIDSMCDDTANDDVGSDDSESLADTVSDTSVEAVPLEFVANTEGDSVDGKSNVEKHENVAEDLNAEKESLVVKENVVDEEEAGKGPLKASNKSTGGSSWLQKASWTQLVSDKNTSSFSITQLFPDLTSDKGEAAGVINNVGNLFSNSNQTASAMKQTDYASSSGGFVAAGVPVDSTPVRSLDENRQRLNGKNVSEGAKLGAKKKIIKRKVGSGDTCTFMRSSTSLKEWAKAKKALSEPRRKKNSEE
ncbi:unnamed protein product [Arabidopsis thaliana]|uniref:(thale cress) hypothetical protein n=1 Tax=Arabidopsis thaliana TaxID=3702 RepID=A0A7G2FJ15_ARATH|nr:unnamed protein product [Arabidopsis thaliana]